MSRKLIITKPGFNAKTETDPNNMIFSSDYGTLKYFDSGSIHFTFTTNKLIYISNQNITHGLGFAPYIEAYVSDDGSTFQPVPIFDTGASTARRYEVLMDATKLYFRVQVENYTIGTAFDITFYYFIFRNNTGLI